MIGQTIGGIKFEGNLKVWRGSFNCSYRWLTSLRRSPEKILGEFDCSNNRLKSLEGGPRWVGKLYNAMSNQLTSLKGAPEFVGFNFSAPYNPLTSLEGAPGEVGGDVFLSECLLSSLRDIHKHFKKINGSLYVGMNPIESHVLGILYIEGLLSVLITYPNNTQLVKKLKKVNDILNRHLPNSKGHRGAIACQSELLDANLDAYAQL